MLSNRYSTIVSQSEITGKAQPDLHSLRLRGNTSGRVAFEGGTIPTNLSIMPGELLVARRNCRNTAGAYGRTMQCGFSSVAGITIDDKNPEELMRELIFLGVAKSEYQYEGDSMFGTDSMDHGIGYLISGSISINNWGNEDIHAFDPIGIRLPPYLQGDPRSQGGNSGRNTIDTGLNPVKHYNRIGTPNGKQLMMIEKFDPCDFSFQIAGSFELINRTKSQGGIKGITNEEFFVRSDDMIRKMDTAQEEAFGYIWGFLTVASIANPNVDYGVGTGTITVEGLQFLRALFGRNVFPGSNPGFEVDRAGDLNGSAADKRRYFQDHVFDLVCGGVAGSMATKRSRLIGTAISSAKPGQTLDVMIRL